ncbi:cell wall metabolism sensor histidine kinase WalK [Streptomyces sp. NBC_00568]|uniref:sensor histidine kinase n=1 Tax=Streptomyces sp. NBC_00568 TaxID=2975779 RepID=UPI00224DE7BD|nr:HAMP domain-containing sensor histidine kinase [Streptomyces sp. NBC_00568]
MATSVLIAICSIGATAWLAVQTTSHAIEQERGQALSDDTEIYDRLTGYAATHPRWDEIAPLVRELAQRAGRRIVLTSPSHHLLADSAASPAPLPARVSAIVDPLHAENGPLFAIRAPTDDSPIDPRATGPYLLPKKERATLRKLANKRVACLRDAASNAHWIDTPSGRPTVKINIAPGAQLPTIDPCVLPLLDAPTPTERAPLAWLNAELSNCLTARKVPVHLRVGASVSPDLSWFSKMPAGRYAEVIEACSTDNRRRQLKPFVAPAALLYLGAPHNPAAPPFDLSPTNTARIATVTGLVLTLTVFVTAVVASRLVHPLRALTVAALSPDRRHHRVPVTTKDETGYLAAAFNEMIERREHLEELRRAMVSDVAHELRTPLTNIRIWLEATEDGIAEPDPPLIASLLEEALLLQRIIDDLQDLAAAEAGQLSMDRKATHLAGVLHQVVAAHRASAEASGVSLASGGDGSIYLLADPARLRQAFGNLVSNAVRHTAPGGSVTLASRRSGDDVVTEVTDTGSGIDPDDLPNLFDRFWRAEKSRSRRSGGSGLGLSIVQQIARAHGGSVSVSSTPGVGSTFAVRMPLTDP